MVFVVWVKWVAFGFNSKLLNPQVFIFVFIKRLTLCRIKNQALKLKKVLFSGTRNTINQFILFYVLGCVSIFSHNPATCDIRLTIIIYICRRLFLTFLVNNMNSHKSWLLKAWVLCMTLVMNQWKRIWWMHLWVHWLGQGNGKELSK